MLGLRCVARSMRWFWTPARPSTQTETETAIVAHVAARVEPIWAKKEEAIKRFKEDGTLDKPLVEVTGKHILGGMRGLPLMIWEPSVVDPQAGIIYRGLSLVDCCQKLPREPGAAYPSPESVFWLLLTGQVPDDEDLKLVKSAVRADVSLKEAVEDTVGLPTPSELSGTAKRPRRTSAKRPSKPAMLKSTSLEVMEKMIKAINTTSRGIHPMTQIIMGIIGAEYKSLLAHIYQPDMSIEDIWKATLLDGLCLLKELPALVGYVYRRTTVPNFKGDYIKEVMEINEAHPDADWAQRLALYMGLGDSPEVADVLRLFILCHADHEGGNVSAHVSHVVNSAHSDIFYSYIASLCGLAGPLHGLANQQSLKWQLDTMEELRKLHGVEKVDELTAEQLHTHVAAQVEKGVKIPGFGHAVLRNTDPRYALFREWGERAIAESRRGVQLGDGSISGAELLRFNHKAVDVVHKAMAAVPKIQSPWPNVDFGSGPVLSFVGITEPTMYTVLFGLSRALGVVSACVWSRIMRLPIERPKSLTLDAFEDRLAQKNP